MAQWNNCILYFCLGLCDEHEYRLTKHLLDGYDAGVRPAKNSSQPLVVVFGLSLHHIIDVVSIEMQTIPKQPRENLIPRLGFFSTFLISYFESTLL